MSRCCGSALGDERGIATLELALLAGVFILMFMLSAYAWRSVQAVSNVSDAAAEAARAASLGTDGSANAEAEAAAQASLIDAGTSCASMSIVVTDGATTTGSTTAETVTVRVDCTVELSDLAAIGGPGSQEVSATHTEIVDVYRGGRP